MAKSIRVSDGMYELAASAGAAVHRSLAEQFEYWARLGAALDAAGISSDEAARLLRGEGGAQVRKQILAHLGGASASAQQREFKGNAAIEKRKKQFEREVDEGRRSPESLLLLDTRRVRKAILTERQAIEAGDGW